MAPSSAAADRYAFEATAMGPGADLHQKVMIVNGGPEVLELLQVVLHADHHDVVFVESMEHAYSRIRHLRPHLVILCVRFDDPDGFRVLSMLKLDEETRAIPVLTLASEGERANGHDMSGAAPEPEMFGPVSHMN